MSIFGPQINVQSQKLEELGFKMQQKVKKHDKCYSSLVLIASISHNTIISVAVQVNGRGV